MNQLQEKLLNGNPPTTQEDWRHLGEVLSSFAGFCDAVSTELDTVYQTLQDLAALVPGEEEDEGDFNALLAAIQKESDANS